MLVQVLVAGEQQRRLCMEYGNCCGKKSEMAAVQWLQDIVR